MRICEVFHCVPFTFVSVHDENNFPPSQLGCLPDFNGMNVRLSVFTYVGLYRSTFRLKCYMLIGFYG